MATGDLHLARLNKLCRICGNTLPDRSHIVQEHIKNLDSIFRADFYSDRAGIHPKKFCHSCFATISNVLKRDSATAIVPVKWYTHKDTECKTCILSAQKKRGGKPMKRRGGGNPTHKAVDSAEKTWTPLELNKIYRKTSELFYYSGNVLSDINISEGNWEHLICSLCSNILKRPLMINQCNHVFCALCLTNWLENSNRCPTCSIPTTPGDVSPGLCISRILNTRVVKGTCGCSFKLLSAQSHTCSPALSFTTLEMMQLSPSKPVPKKVEECIAHVVGIKMQQSNLPNKTVQLPSGSSQVRLLMYGVDSVKVI